MVHESNDFAETLTRRLVVLVVAAILFIYASVSYSAPASNPVDFNREVRGILSENCFKCHGPDAKKRKNGEQSLRLDLSESARADLGDGTHAIVPGHPEQSELIRRITSEDLDEKMPPPDSDKKLTKEQVATLTKWIKQGAQYSRHWSYAPPQRSALPKVRDVKWAKTAIDHFILERLVREKLKPSPEADRAALIRRVALDLTGLPPTLAEVDQFISDREPNAYERLVDRLLKKESFGEHWARLWLDQARYADSSGYADDPPRTIWAYRDYVIRSLNANKHFDQFTLEQIAGDLLDDATDEQRIATAFHRNTMTNNEGGTDDEEFRNVAIVDRVNTTMAVWMGTTMACAQCHNHKYDPITQEEYFKLFAILNNTADADKTDESPVHELFTPEQKSKRKELHSQIATLEKLLNTPTPELEKAQSLWAKTFKTDLTWQIMQPTAVKSKAGAIVHRNDDSTVRFERGGKTDVYTLEIPAQAGEDITALRLEVLPDKNNPGSGVGHDDGNFVVSRVRASITPAEPKQFAGRFVRIELPGKEKILSLAEVQVFSGETNVAAMGEASQSSTTLGAEAKRANDSKTNGDFPNANSTTHTETSSDPWWEIDLKSSVPTDRVVVWNRTDSSAERLSNFRIVLLDEKREQVWEQQVQSAPDPSLELRLDGSRTIEFASATADFSEKDFDAKEVLHNKKQKTQGWAVAPKTGEPHALTLIPKTPVVVGAGSNLVITIDQLFNRDYATIAQLRLSKSTDMRAPEFAVVPAATLEIIQVDAAKRTEAQWKELLDYYLTMAPALQGTRDELASAKKTLNEIKPATTVPIQMELAADKRRKTHIHLRGNFMTLGDEVNGGLPSAFGAQSDPGHTDRLALARWLVSTNNPLTARVVVNRLWESIFGIGIVRTSEEFGSQGDAPSHPELLDWLAVELMENHWDVNHVLRLMVASSTYRQSSRVTPALLAKDPDNHLLARGPRFRLSAEMIRDQALAVSGLLSSKMFGPPVKPPQPNLGLRAAFGGATDWETSSGEDRHRRAIYTTWRRSNPYPSMATFDAPNREVCLVRRDRSNTPLQALVTLNDPVYMEAAQALARRMDAVGNSPSDKLRHGFRLCLSRAPTEKEMKGLLELFSKAHARFKNDNAKAVDVATKPLGDAPKDADVTELAAWTVVGNVLLNLDEMLMKR